MSRKYSVVKSFGFAFSGIRQCLKQEPNLKIHTTFAIAALILAYFLKFSVLEWLILLITISLVLVLEFINTSFEAIVDLLSPEIKPTAKVAKDVAASAVFLAAVLSVVVGLALFLPKILLLF